MTKSKMLVFAVVVLASVLAPATGQYGVNNIDPFAVDNKFFIDCGNTTHKKMHVLFRGDARMVYAPADPLCIAAEVEPAHFIIDDAMTNVNCNPIKTTGFELYTLELVVQVGAIRQWTDKTHMVSCNYELGGQQSSSSKITKDSSLVRTPQLGQGNSQVPTSVVTLELRDTTGKAVTGTTIGSYVQLYAHMTASGQETSFRPWNCRAYTNDTGVFDQHYILLEGCGDDQVILQQRGFYTQQDGATGNRISRSVYFRAFALMGAPTLVFECDYIVTNDTSADGASCRRSPSRVRRSVSMMETTLPAVSTDPIRLLSRAESQTPQMDYVYAEKAPATSNLRHGELSERTDVLSEPAVIGMLSVIGGLLFTIMLLIVLTVFLCLRLPGSSLGNATHYHPAPGYKA